MRLYGGTFDKLADPADLNAFWGELSPGVQEYFKIYQNIGHCTFLLGLDTTPWMSHVISTLGDPLEMNNLTEE
mgnify:CR=1 FL=1